MWQIREGGSSAQCTPVRICRTRRVSVSLPSSNQLMSAPSRVNSRSPSSAGTLRRIGIQYRASSVKSVEPLLVAALVQQLGLAIEKLLDVLPDDEPGEIGGLGAHGAASAVQLSASMSWRQRP